MLGAANPSIDVDNSLSRVEYYWNVFMVYTIEHFAVCVHMIIFNRRLHSTGDVMPGKILIGECDCAVYAYLFFFFFLL